ncbi:hypothetical protein [Paraflavitalea speifideaquila]|uniref:hypothetical protein n=1 Tax=Paraflavitalea speifideaquila TaxID=3076558 RepID=UPI0028E9E6C7|nr:hypothetical protein [Paraflavitalea speifideiaquila]
MKINAALLLLTLFLAACDRNIFSSPTDEQQAYVPVYAKPTEINDIAVEAERPTKKQEKFFIPACPI